MEIILALHNCGLIHRDIRPLNIIVGRNDIIYLIDFAYLIDIKNINHFLKELPHNSINNNQYHQKL